MELLGGLLAGEAPGRALPAFMRKHIGPGELGVGDI